MTAGKKQAAGDEVREVLDSFRRIVRLFRLASSEAQRNFGLSGAQVFVLQALAEAKMLSINDLAECTQAVARLASVAADAAGEPPAFVPLGSIARLKVAEGPNQISRENGKRRVVVQTNVRGRDIGSFVEETRQKIDQQVKLPSGTWLTWGGQFENLQAARDRLTVVVPVCFFVMFLLLFSSFGSFKHALMVLPAFRLPSPAGFLHCGSVPFSISAADGFIALSGVAVLNGLVLVAYMYQLREEGLSLEEAVQQGPMVRLRPVLMTAMVAILGFVPMAIAHGAGAEVQKPLATAVIGGLISATLLTLFVLPALYRMWDRAEPVRPSSTAVVAAGDNNHGSVPPSEL